jgi:deoxyribodipyrimidine photolyase-related protein
MIRHLVVVLGDQLNFESAVFDDFDPRLDRVWMAEATAESTHVWSHKARIALFLSAMRHFRTTLEALGRPVTYRTLGCHSHASLTAALRADLERLRPQRLVMAQAGEYRLHVGIEQVTRESGIPLELRDDRHFLMTLPDFATWHQARKVPRTEHLYRHLRERTGLLMDDGKPVGGRWNFDADNRRAFGRDGPGAVPAPKAFAPDEVTRQVLQTVEDTFPDHPGSLSRFDWPVTPAAAEQALEDFIRHRLPVFGPHQDAMWTGEPFLFHSRLSAALNLRLISPRQVIDRAVDALEAGQAGLASVEGFIRQIVGWREMVRGIYWTHMPHLAEMNALDSHQPLPRFYWTGETDMTCLADTIRQTLAYGYAHHIQRLMVTGLFALLLGVEPRQVHAWYLAVYVDAVEWVELPNTIGMSQHADGGLLGSKPYAASGRYIDRMSNYCRSCRFRPDQSLGARACPFTTLYWDFLLRHRARFAQHPRSAQQWRILSRLDAETAQSIAREATRLREHFAH